MGTISCRCVSSTDTDIYKTKDEADLNRNLHNRLLDTVMNGTIRFFNVTPVGRILNRFSKGKLMLLLRRYMLKLTHLDIETIDTSLNGGLRTVIVYVASLIGALATVAVIVPWFLLPAAIISWLYFQYSVLYVSFMIYTSEG